MRDGFTLLCWSYSLKSCTFATNDKQAVKRCVAWEQNAAQDLVEVKSWVSSHKTNLEIKRQSIIKSGFAETVTNAFAYDVRDD